MRRLSIALTTVLPILGMAAASAAHAQRAIVHDGEYEFLRAQFGEQWDAQDTVIDERLAGLREANGGAPPNVLFVLIDDVSFGLMGNRALNYVTGFDTVFDPKKFADRIPSPERLDPLTQWLEKVIRPDRRLQFFDHPIVDQHCTKKCCLGLDI